MQGVWKYEIVSEFMENEDINTFVKQNQGVNRPELVSFDLRLSGAVE